MIIGELINASRKLIKEAIDQKNAEYIRQVAREQEQGGADCLDVNCGTEVGTEGETIKWLIENIQAVSELPVCFDSPDAKTLEEAILFAKAPAKGKHMINSISGETNVYSSIIPLLQKYDVNVVALCMDDKGIPDSYEERVRVVDQLMASLRKDGIADSRVYIDPLIKPVSTNDQFGIEVLHFVSYIKETYPDVHMACGLSNISFGLPNRKFVNRVFLVQLMSAGMDSFILNPTDKAIVGAYITSGMLMGNDRRCLKYLKAYRKGLFS